MFQGVIHIHLNELAMLETHSLSWYSGVLVSLPAYSLLGAAVSPRRSLGDISGAPDAGAAPGLWSLHK